MKFRLADIADVLGCAPPHPPDAPVNGYSIDSRTVRPGELFFAVQGKKLDGHDYVASALDAGAVAAVVAGERRGDFPESARSKLLAVPDTLRALQQLAATARRRWGGPLVAVTGSMGKTTTKQMAAALLRTHCRVLENEGNLNNHFGLPLSLLRLEPDTEAGVFELAMSGPGEIRLLADLAAPDVAVVTNVGPVHLEFFADVDAIARAKFELIEALGERAWAVLNADDARVTRFGERVPGRALSFGFSAHADVRGEDLVCDARGGWAFTLASQALPAAAFGAARRAPGAERWQVGEPTRFHLPMVGRHNVLNALAALSVAYLFGIPPGALKDAVAELRPGSMRGEVVRLTNGATAVIDCYNSNPTALNAMLEAVQSLPGQRRIAVLGAMLELGGDAAALHAQCGARVAELGFDLLITVGAEADAVAEGARRYGLPAGKCIRMNTPEEAGKWLRRELREGDVVLFKASRAAHLERAWDQLGEHRLGEPELATARKDRSASVPSN